MATKKTARGSKAAIELVAVGDYEYHAADPACRAPAAVRELFPADCKLARATDGTWYGFAKDPEVAKNAHAEFETRLYWLEGKAVRRAAVSTTRVAAPSFDRERGIALVVKDGVTLGEIDLASGAFGKLAVAGLRWKKGSKRIYRDAHVMGGGRALVGIADGATTVLYVCERSGKGSSAGASTTLFGEMTIVDGRVIVGGAEKLSCVAIDRGGFRLLARFDDVEVQDIAIVGGRPRIYGGKGCFEVAGIAAALRAFDHDPTRFPLYEGSPE